MSDSETASRVKNSQSKSFRKLNPHLFGGHGHEDDEELEHIAALTAKPKAKKRIRQSNKPILNKLENEYFLRTKALLPGTTILPQSLRFRLGNGIWYKPDLALFTNGGPVEVYEIKGPHAFRGGFENLKVAAGLYKEVRFFLVWKDEEGRWQEQHVLP